MDEMKCGHELCHCKGNDVKEDGYCSTECREGRTGGDQRCACGHADCK